MALFPKRLPTINNYNNWKQKFEKKKKIINNYNNWSQFWLLVARGPACDWEQDNIDARE